MDSLLQKQCGFQLGVIPKGSLGTGLINGQLVTEPIAMWFLIRRDGLINRQLVTEPIAMWFLIRRDGLINRQLVTEPIAMWFLIRRDGLINRQLVTETKCCVRSKSRQLLVRASVLY